jgi:anti-anti-sigma factor
MFRPATQQLSIRSTRDGHAHVIALDGELDMDTSQAFEDELDRVERTDVRAIIIDLGGLHWIGYDGLKTVIQANMRAIRSGRRLVLLRGPDSVHDTFEMAGLAWALPFADADDVLPRGPLAQAA